MDLRLLSSIFLLLACNPIAPEQKTPVSSVADSTLVIASNPIDSAEKADTITPKFKDLTSFLNSRQPPIDSAAINRFSGSWYAYIYPDTYKGFQQFGVIFPFEYIIEDSVGMPETLHFNSVSEIAKWRAAQPSCSDWVLRHFQSPDRVLWEGYPHLLYGDKKNFAVPDDLDSNQAIVTYLYPMHKVDYYLRKGEGLWQVFKRREKVFSQQDLQNLATESFEGFALRFISDTPFRIKSTKWPLRDSDISIEDGSAKVSFIKKADSHLNHFWEDALLMNVSQGSKGWQAQTDTLYFRSKSEGGACFGSIFKKINAHWTLIETWDASN